MNSNTSNVFLHNYYEPIKNLHMFIVEGNITADQTQS